MRRCHPSKGARMTEHIFKLAPPPPPSVGGYRMGEAPGYIQFNLTKKPCWLHRLGVRLVLGWKWVDE